MLEVGPGFFCEEETLEQLSNYLLAIGASDPLTWEQVARLRPGNYLLCTDALGLTGGSRNCKINESKAEASSAGDGFPFVDGPALLNESLEEEIEDAAEE